MSRPDMAQITDESADAYSPPRSALLPPLAPADPSARVIGYLFTALALLLLVAASIGLGVWIARPMTAAMYAAAFIWGGVVGALAVMVWR